MVCNGTVSPTAAHGGQCCLATLSPAKPVFTVTEPACRLLDLNNMPVKWEGSPLSPDPTERPQILSWFCHVNCCQPS